MAKKKSAQEAETANSSPYPAGPSTTSTPTSDNNNNGVEDKGPYVVFQLADGSERSKRRLKQNVNFNSILPKIIKQLAPDASPQHVRFAHVRGQGREVDLIDEYDYASFQRRALDNSTITQHIKVYIPSTSTQSISIPNTPQIQPPQTPSPAGLVNNDNNMFETPKARSKKDKKGKRKAEDEAPLQSQPLNGPSEVRPEQSTSSSFVTSSSSIPTPAITTSEPSTSTKSSKKKKQKASEATSQNMKSPASSSSFDEPSASPHSKSMSKIDFTTSPSGSTFTPIPKKNKKRKRASDPSDVEQSEPSETAIASSSTITEDANTSDQQRTSKSPEKKKKKKNRKSDGTTEQSTPAPSSPITQINLSSNTPSMFPTHLQKYKPATPSPLGRLPTPSVDGDADESIEEPSPKTTAREMKKKSKKAKKESAEVVDGQSEASLEKVVEQEDQSTELGKEAEQAEVATPTKKKSKSKKAQPEVGTVPETPQPGVGASVSEVEAPASETTDTPATNQKKKAKKPKKKPEVAQETNQPATGSAETTEIAQDIGEPMEVDQTPSKTSTAPFVQPIQQLTNGIPKSGIKRYIPLSNPYIYYSKPNAPLPRYIANYTSSSLDRSPQKVYGKSAKKVKLPEQDVNDDDAQSLEEEELPKSPELPKKVTKRKSTSNKVVVPVESDNQEDEPATDGQGSNVPVESEILVEALKKSKAKRKSTATASAKEKQKEKATDDEDILPDNTEENEVLDTPEKEEGQTKKKDDVAVTDEQVDSSPAADATNDNATPAIPSSREPSPPAALAQPETSYSTSSSPDSSKIRRHITSTYHKNLASRGQCIICDGPPHLQKDCPEVVEGVDNLRSLLGKKKGQKKTELIKSSIEAIETWINRMEKITATVKGTSSPITTPSKKDDQQTIAPASEPAPAPAPTPVSEPVNVEPIPVIAKEKLIVPRETSTPSDPAEPSSVSQVSSPTSSASPEPALQASQQSQPLQSPSREHGAPPIYFKALATKAGSVSGLSVSDAVIETGSSASESDSEDESGSSSGSGSDGDSDAESTGSKGSQTSVTRSKSRSRSGSATSFARSPSPPVQGSGSLGSLSLNDFMSMPLSQNLKRRARESAAGMKDVEMDEEIQEPSDTESTPERQLPPSSFVIRPRAGSESSVGEFADEKSDEEVDMDEDEVMPFTQPQPPNIESAQDEQPETIEVETAPEEPTVPEGPNEEVSKSPTKDQNKRSFIDLADAASPSPVVAEFPGSIALQEAIDEDAAPEGLMDVDPSPRNEDGKSGHVISQGLMSPPSSSDEGLPVGSSEPMPATQLVNGDNQASQEEEATPRPLRRRVPRGAAREDNELAPPIDIVPSSSQPLPSSSQPLPSSPPRRRLRSMSREPTIEPMSPRITTRRVSASQPEPSSSRYRSKSPSSSLPVRRSTRRTTPSSQIDELISSPIAAAQPRRNSRRGTTPLRSSPPPEIMKTPAVIPEEDESESELELVKESTQQTPEGLKTPLVPETQESEPRHGNRALRSRPSPLFMSQGSQIPQTQAYNLYPNLPSSDTGISLNESDTQTPKGKVNGTIAESPLSTRKSNGLNRKSSLRFTSPILEDDEREVRAEDKEEEGEEKQDERVEKVKDSQPQEESDDEGDMLPNGNGKINGDGDKNEDDGGSSSESSKSSSDSEDEVMKIPLPKLRSTRSTSSLYPTLPRSPLITTSQPTSTPTNNGYPFPTLSSLSKDALRSRTSFGFPSSSQPNPSTSTSNSGIKTKSRMSLPTRHQLSKSQPIPINDNSSSSESGSESDSSEEEKTPIGLKGRFAKGGRDKSKLRRASQANIGW